MFGFILFLEVQSEKGGGNQWQEYDPSNGRYGYGGDDPFGFRPYAYYHMTSKRKFRHSKKERTINPNKQNRHLGIQADGRSDLYGTLTDTQKIVDDYSGKRVNASPMVLKSGARKYPIA
jgi:hypothetical protein